MDYKQKQNLKNAASAFLLCKERARLSCSSVKDTRDTKDAKMHIIETDKIKITCVHTDVLHKIKFMANQWR